MIRFECDYTEGAHERILKRLLETNDEQTPGYGVDDHCEKARAYIKEACDSPNADVHFLVGGTQTNTTVISSILRPHQGVVAAVSGHVVDFMKPERLKLLDIKYLLCQAEMGRSE